MYVLYMEVSISNVIPESLDICPQLHLKQISQSSGITILIHTSRHTHWTNCVYVSGYMYQLYMIMTYS